jgi:hypothetical protein
MRRLVIVLALLALGGCKGGWTECNLSLIARHPKEGLWVWNARYRVLNAEPLTIEWEGYPHGSEHQSSGVISNVTTLECNSK